jgi:DNA polymerase III subunit epsilon
MQAIAGFQPSLDQATPLREATFCVVDLETTGGSPTACAITEVGAVKYRGGERIGALQTLVDPGRPIPRSVTHLNGIDDAAVAGMPPIEAVVPELLEFVRGGVFVAHNARFDFSFVNASLARLDYEPLRPPPVCTARLARRVVWPDVPNVRLSTLARYFRTSIAPTHRALDDAEACAEVLHGLLELGGRLGILTLGDLHEVVRARGRPNYAKIRLADKLPHAAGVYVFTDRRGRVLYVGKSKDLRARVKSYFYGDARKKVQNLLAQARDVDGIPCASELEALVLEARLIHRHEPTYNRRGKSWRRYAYLRLDASEAYPRLKVVRSPTAGGVFLGPFSSSRRATLAKEAIEDATAIRRCTIPMRPTTRASPCILADIGRCAAPCVGATDVERYGELVRELTSSLSNPGGLLESLERRMRRLADARRYEDAAHARDRLQALVEGIVRTRADAWLASPGTFVVRDRTGARIRIRDGALMRGADDDPVALPCPPDRADELAAVRSWLTRNPVVVQDADAQVAEPVAGGRAVHRLAAELAIATREREAERDTEP